ncbi:type VI secretion system-associated protein TagF [Mesorhizobium sp. M0293]|uniref:type VI secretion system-associated protein TagF n=2 Tax=Mesorhizobium TaxID=68287 RepID=UPI003339E0D0
MSAADMTTGFFGKIPATGDFVAWNLPRTFIDRWDRWMSMELLARPDEGELDSRVWRFTVPAAIFCEQSCAGVWRMSEDRVGRRYPFAIVAIGPVPDMAAPWFDEIHEIARAAIDQGWLAAAIEGKLAAIAAPVASPLEVDLVFWSDDWEVKEFRFRDIHDLAANALPAMRAAPMQTEIF